MPEIASAMHLSFFHQTYRQWTTVTVALYGLPAAHALEVVVPLGPRQALYENPCELVPVFCTVSLQLHALTSGWKNLHPLSSSGWLISKCSPGISSLPSCSPTPGMNRKITLLPTSHKTTVAL